MKYRLAIFDFDGTLADSFPFFVSVLNELAERHDFKKIDTRQIAAFRHCSARQVMKSMGLPHWKLPLVANSCMALMRSNADAIPLFDGMEETLGYLADKGVTLSILTSNSCDNVRHIMGPQSMQLFTHLECGMSIFGKQSRIRKVLGRAAIPGHEAIYIGDQITDCEAARRAGVAFGAVAWGYGAIEALRRYAPDEVFDSVAALRRIG